MPTLMSTSFSFILFFKSATTSALLSSSKGERLVANMSGNLVIHKNVKHFTYSILHHCTTSTFVLNINLEQGSDLVKQGV